MDNKALYKIGYGLYVLTVKDGEVDNGCIINTFMQLTSSPTVVALAVNKQNHTHDILVKTGECNVSVLTVNAPFELYKHFGFQSGRDTNKFADYLNSARASNGILYLPYFTSAYMSMKVIDKKDLGTHTLFYAEVTNSEVLSDIKSVSYAYYHANIKPKPQKNTSAKTIWRCTVCGYEYEGEELPPDFVCPLCKHGAADFEKV